jgi:tripartite-type tricarboxylate transporter receptor subunit TctC
VAEILNRLLVLMLSLAAGVCIAQSSAFPVKPVRFVVGFTPGGPSDILARALGQKLGELWGQRVTIENRPGAARPSYKTTYYKGARFSDAYAALMKETAAA